MLYYEKLHNDWARVQQNLKIARVDYKMKS